MIRRITSLILSLIMLVSAVPVQVFADDVVESTAHEHVWDEGVVTAPDCDSVGCTTYTCINCGETRSDTEVSALGHAWGEGVVTAPNCEKVGYTTYTCATCNETYNDAEVSALGHSWGDWTVTLEPTVEAEGQRERSCTVCSEKEMEFIAKLPQPEQIAVTSVEIIQLDENGNKMEEEITELTVGDTLSLTAAVLPGNAADKAVIWFSSDETMATVDTNGTVTAVAAGEVTVTAACGEITDTYALTVKTVPQQEEPVVVTSIEITAESDCIAPGETLQLTAAVLPEDAADQSVIWSSQDESVLTVDEKGVVTGVADGCTFVVVMAADGKGASTQYKITVIEETVEIEEADAVAAPITMTESVMSLYELKEKFPDGKYWNHVKNSFHVNDYYDSSKCNTPDNWTDTPCSDHGEEKTGAYACNRFNGAIQCQGFAKKLAYDAYGKLVDSWDISYNRTDSNEALKNYVASELKPGDVLGYYGNGTDDQYGHWVFVIGVDGNAITVAECNVGEYDQAAQKTRFGCKIRWGNVIYKDKITPATIYSAPCELDTSEDYPNDSAIEEGLRTELGSGKTSIKLEGSVTLDKDLVIPEGTTLTIASGKTLTVPQGVKLTNNGKIIVGEEYASSKSFLKIYGSCENYGDITIYDGGMENEGVFTNNGEIIVAGWGTVHFINSGTMTNSGRIFVSGAWDDALDAQFINSGTYSQTGSFQQWNGYVTGVSPTNIDLHLHAQVTTADIQELIDANYERVSLYVQNDLTITQNLTLPENFSFLFEGSTLTIPEGIRMTIETDGFCELSRDGMHATVDVQGELYINGNAEMWDWGTLNVSGHLVVNYWLVMQGKLNILDGGMLTNNGSIDNYEKPVDLTVSDTAIVLNNGYIAGMSNTPDLPTEESEIWLDEDRTIAEDWIIPDGTSVYIGEDVTVTVSDGVTVDIQGYVEVYGNLILEEGSILTITDEYLNCLNIWTGRLDATGADISGVPYGTVGIQLNSTAEIVGIPTEMLYATVCVYSTKDVNAALALAPGYKRLHLLVDSSFVLMNSITIPDNTEFFIWQWDPEMDAPTVVIPGGVTVTNNGWLTVDSGYFVVERGGKLINNGYAEVSPSATMLVYGELQQNGDFYGTYETPVDYAYKISFNKNAKDAKGTMKSISGNISEGGSLPANTFTYAKKVFTGWNTKADGSGISYTDCESLANIVTQDNTNLTLYAQWRDIRYTLEFKADGITVGSVELGYNEKYKLEDFNTHKLGYHVGSWKNASNKKTYSLGTTVSKLASKEGAVVVFNANWTVNTFKIAYNGNGSSSVKIKNLSVTYNKKFSLASGSYKYTYKGCQYELKGWSTEPHAPSLDYTYDYVKGKAFSAAACAELTKTWTHGSTKTLYAVWGPVEYKITYKNVPSNATNSNPSLYNTVQGLKAFADLDVPGYKFGGWYADSKFKKPITNISKGQTGTKTVYAKINPISYKIKYDLNGGTNNKKNPTSYKITQKKTLYAPTRTGYTFAGWYLGSNKLSSLKANTFYGGDIVLAARWNPIAYTIKYYANGGAFAKGARTTQRVAYGDAAMLMDRSAISKAGYTLTGWNSKSTCDGKSYWISTSNLSAKSGATVKLYAMWEYPIVLHGNYNGASDHELSLYYNQSRKLTSEGFSRQGYTFKGWAISKANASKGKVKYANNKSVKNLAPGTELWAVWSANSVKITFNKNDGTKSPAKKTQTLKAGVNLPATLFSRTDLRIVEWNTKKDGSGTAYKPNEPVANIAKKSSSSLTLYAIWKQAEGYHITFDANGGTGTMNAVTLAVGARIPKCTFTAPSGLVFAGWKINNEGRIIQDEELVSALGETNGVLFECTLYAQWKNTASNGCTANSFAEGCAELIGLFDNMSKMLNPNAKKAYFTVTGSSCKLDSVGIGFMYHEGCSDCNMNKVLDKMALLGIVTKEFSDSAKKTINDSKAGTCQGFHNIACFFFFGSAIAEQYGSINISQTTTNNQIKSFFANAKAGDKIGTSPNHPMIIVAVNDDGVVILDNNSLIGETESNVIRTHLMTWMDFRNSFSSMRLFRYPDSVMEKYH